MALLPTMKTLSRRECVQYVVALETSRIFLFFAFLSILLQNVHKLNFLMIKLS